MVKLTHIGRIQILFGSYGKASARLRSFIVFKLTKHFDFIPQSITLQLQVTERDIQNI